ncbi:hypothetical protein DBT_2339 [Dissulfuribacter thermophilus]|uniref:Uncharacterized protein n=1 Tax=Dissulfuribacter thermophilus TaxID=1156395 RepID=A0A1B9F2V9_9BACT|nr:hypothetical protein [Dissulfuribacter thermophilus]OCC14267.1 hypothetical protein DBT_2339 [Dissulfuribacter thermophilus]
MENGIRSFSDYDLFLNKLYASGRQIIWKDPFDIAFLWEKCPFDLARVQEDFQKKFPGQNFYLYLKAAVAVEDYPELKEMPKICKTLKDIENAFD